MSQIPLFKGGEPGQAAWSVSSITRYIRELIEGDELLQDTWVVGEVSNYTRASSGHLYFTLKDSGAALRCVMWRSQAARLGFAMADGAAVEVHGSLNVYEMTGVYQLYADTIRPAGEGALYQEFLRLKAKLEAEGLFDAQFKRPIPRWPLRIGIVTSPTGAALRDMLNTLERRYPLAEVVLAPTPVQGFEAPPAIVAALDELNRAVHPDVILLARGGGSIEDLWAFNDERVARALRQSAAPVITGVGHETDFTIADFASDLRAPTPTAAAELATPNVQDLQAGLIELSLRVQRAIEAGLQVEQWALDRLRGRLTLASPASRLRSGRQTLDEYSRRLQVGAGNRLTLLHARLAGIDQRLAALNPLAVLKRGYAVVSQEDGTLVRSVRQLQPGQSLKVRVADGSFAAKAGGVLPVDGQEGEP